MGDTWIPPNMSAIKASVALGSAGFELRNRWEASSGVQRRRLGRLLQEVLQPAPLTAAGGLAPLPSAADEMTESLLDTVAVLTACGEFGSAARSAEVLVRRMRRRADERAGQEFAALRSRVDAHRSPPPAPEVPAELEVEVEVEVPAEEPPPPPVPVSGPRVRRLSAPGGPVRQLSAAAGVRRLSVAQRSFSPGSRR